MLVAIIWQDRIHSHAGFDRKSQSIIATITICPINERIILQTVYVDVVWSIPVGCPCYCVSNNMHKSHFLFVLGLGSEWAASSFCSTTPNFINF